jgi:hypothetical protein
MVEKNNDETPMKSGFLIQHKPEGVILLGLLL